MRNEGGRQVGGEHGMREGVMEEGRQGGESMARERDVVNEEGGTGRGEMKDGRQVGESMA